MFKFIKKIFERIKKMIYKGNTAVEDVYVGNTKIGEVYKGDELVYQSSKIKYAGMSYVPAHADGTQPTGWADGDGAQSAVRCLTLVLKNGAAKAIPFALYNDNIHLAPTDAQIEGASWIEGDYTGSYNSGTFQNNVWTPAVASSHSSGIAWTPATGGTRFVRNESLYMWGWPITSGDLYSNAISPDYSVSVVNGVCYMYYQGTLVKKIRA